MGTDADAYLYFGWPLSDEDVRRLAELMLPDADEETTDDGERFLDWERIAGNVRGVKSPEAAYDEHDPAAVQAYREYWAQLREAEASMLVKVESAGYCDNPTYFISAISYFAYYGNHLELPNPLPATAIFEETLRRVSGELGISYTTPHWYLTNYLSY